MTIKRVGNNQYSKGGYRNPIRLCACGCEGPYWDTYGLTEKSKHHNKKGYIRGHGRRGKTNSEEHNNIVRNANIGKPCSIATRKKISAATIGKTISRVSIEKGLFTRYKGIFKRDLHKVSKSKSIVIKRNPMFYCGCGCGEPMYSKNKRVVYYLVGHGLRGRKGKAWTEEAKIALSSTWSIDAREAARKRSLGKSMLDSTKKKISDALKEKAHNKGKHLSLEVKAKISKSITGRKLSEDHCRHIKDYINSEKGKIQGRNASIASCKALAAKGFRSKPEHIFSDILVNAGITFHYGVSINNIVHRYVPDFVIPEYNLIIEIDGTYWHNYPYGNKLDSIRNCELQKAGYRVLRIWEGDYNTMENDFLSYIEDLDCSFMFKRMAA